MEQILDAPSPQENRLKYAGFWIRFVAYIIDGVLLSIVQYMIGSLFISDYDFTSGNLGVSFISLIVGIGYFAGLESSSRQATLGKMALNLKVVDTRGQRISFANALGRYFAKILSVITLLIGFMMAGWDPKKQALHDKLADTLVVEA